MSTPRTPPGRSDSRFDTGPLSPSRTPPGPLSRTPPGRSDGRFDTGPSSPTISLPRSTRRTLFDEDIMSQIRLTSDTRQFKTRRGVRLQIACALLIMFFLFCTAGEYALGIHPSYAAFSRAKAVTLQKREYVNSTVAESFCIPHSNVVSNPTFVDFANWTKTANHQEFRPTAWKHDNSPAGVYLHHYADDYYPAPDYPKLMQRIRLVANTEYTVSMSAQFAPRFVGNRDHIEVSLHILRDRTFYNPLFTATSFTGANIIANGTFYGTFTAETEDAYILLMAGSFNYDSYIHKLTIHPTAHGLCQDHDPMNSVDLIEVL